ncbi:MAG: hypothetical protein ACE5JM_10785, partial [Armatimonadota bacterium]
RINAAARTHGLAYNQLVWLLEAASLPPRRLAMEAETQWGYEFQTPKGLVKVVWDAEGESSIAWPPGRRVLDLWGNELPRDKRISLSSAPVYIVEE